jgi:molecular chaperone DnaK
MKRRVLYKVVKASNGDVHVVAALGGERKTYSPSEISAMILGKLKTDAEAKVGEKITQSVITGPPYFKTPNGMQQKRPARLAYGGANHYKRGDGSLFWPTRRAENLQLSRPN